MRLSDMEAMLKQDIEDIREVLDRAPVLGSGVVAGLNLVTGVDEACASSPVSIGRLGPRVEQDGAIVRRLRILEMRARVLSLGDERRRGDVMNQADV